MNLARIVFTVVGAVCLIPVVVLCATERYVWAAGLAASAFVCFLLVALFKNLQTRREKKQNPPAPQGDFFHPQRKEEETGKDGTEK